ncbi:ABC transporter permease [Candidatus Pacearchaeota archaeon]|nr:ABC transporter permease [Candidatus Pacearchaeota archaeon]
MKDYFFLAFNNLKRRKLRSWLTMIGIFIGIAAVVALISLGQGLQSAIEEQFEQLGSDKIIIMPKGMGPPGTASSDSLILTSKDLKVIENVRGVEYAFGYLTKQGQAKYKGESVINYAAGINSEDFELMAEMGGLTIIDGRKLEKGDKFKVVVGYNHVYKDTWDKSLGVGNTIEIEGYDFKVVGVMSKIGNPIDDNLLYVSKDVLKEILEIEDEESQIIAKASSGFNPIDVAETIERKLRKSRGEKEEQETFSVQTSEQLLESFSNIFGIVQAVLVGIAGISLLVGGIGIMNTMYTSVLERTKEIGTMKAIGAKNSDILLIFLFESGLLGLVGGGIGIGIGIGLGEGAEYIASISLGTNLLQAVFPWYLIIGALLFSFLIGTLSGIFPAMQAAKLKPADALRYE